ncbi:MAG: YihY/virulence factor BrkB family protein [Fusobacteria bacterium]|nr:YihY/virulence factor BrkB family protein [Fusobacteriota bacterium]
MINNLFKKVWNANANNLNGIKKFLLLMARVGLLTYRGFLDDRCMLTSSGLTYYTLLGLLPAFGIFISITRGFGLSDVLKEALLKHFWQYDGVINNIFMYATNIIYVNSHNIIITVFGILFVFWAVVRILGSIEVAINDVWRVKVTRSAVRRYTTYVVIIILIPLLIILFLNFDHMLEREIQKLMRGVTFFNLGEILALHFFNILNLLFICFIFVLMYTLFPNTKVKFSAAFASSIITCFIYLAIQTIYVKIQVMSIHYSVVYGSIAIIPLFIFWMRVNWLIIMIGAELTYAFQNVFTYEYHYFERELSSSTKRVLHLFILHKIIKQFELNETKWDYVEFSKSFKMPSKLTNGILENLMEAMLIVKVVDEATQKTTYLPAQDINQMSISSVYNSLENSGEDLILKYIENKDLQNIIRCVNGLHYTILESKYNQLLKDF